MEDQRPITYLSTGNDDDNESTYKQPHIQCPRDVSRTFLPATSRLRNMGKVREVWVAKGMRKVDFKIRSFRTQLHLKKGCYNAIPLKRRRLGTKYNSFD